MDGFVSALLGCFFYHTVMAILYETMNLKLQHATLVQIQVREKERIYEPRISPRMRHSIQGTRDSLELSLKCMQGALMHEASQSFAAQGHLQPR